MSQAEDRWIEFWNALVASAKGLEVHAIHTFSVESLDKWLQDRHNEHFGWKRKTEEECPESTLEVDDEDEEEPEDYGEVRL